MTRIANIVAKRFFVKLSHKNDNVYALINNVNNKKQDSERRKILIPKNMTISYFCISAENNPNL